MAAFLFWLSDQLALRRLPGKGQFVESIAESINDVVIPALRELTQLLDHIPVPFRFDHPDITRIDLSAEAARPDVLCSAHPL